MTVLGNNQSKTLGFLRQGKRDVSVVFDSPRVVPKPLALDIVFVMDTTGSMGEEIERLKTTIELIHLNLTNLKSKPMVRFGMVLYKDIEDEYRTRTIPLTTDLDAFRIELDKVYASGGGDTPEDLLAHLQSEHFRVLRGAMCLLTEPCEMTVHTVFHTEEDGKDVMDDPIVKKTSVIFP